MYNLWKLNFSFDTQMGKQKKNKLLLLVITYNNFLKKMLLKLNFSSNNLQQDKDTLHMFLVFKKVVLIEHNSYYCCM